MTATEMKTDINVLCVIVGGCFLRQCDRASIVDIEVNQSGYGNVKQLEERAKPKAFLESGSDGHVLGLSAGECLCGLFLGDVGHNAPIKEPAVTGHGDSIFQTACPICVTETMQVTGASGIAIM